MIIASQYMDLEGSYAGRKSDKVSYQRNGFRGKTRVDVFNFFQTKNFIFLKRRRGTE